MKHKTWTLTTFLLTLLALGSPLWAQAPEGLATEVSLLIGRPPADGAPGAEGVLVVPGIVIPAESDDRLDDVLAKAGGEKEARLLVRNTRLKQVADGLLESLRLGNVEVKYQMRLDLEVNEIEDLPSPSSTSDVAISVQLLGYNGKTASYEVLFYEGSTPLTKTPLTVQRGKQAVVGGLDGEDAPYLFLVIAPDPVAPTDTQFGPIHVAGDVKPPIAISKPAPVYTPEAKEKRVQGVVIVRSTIGVDGQVSDVKVLKSLPYGLAEAAEQAIRTWTFEPATLNGDPVAVYYNLTINFRLEPDKLDAEKE